MSWTRTARARSIMTRCAGREGAVAMMLSTHCPHTVHTISWPTNQRLAATLHLPCHAQAAPRAISGHGDGGHSLSSPPPHHHRRVTHPRPPCACVAPSQVAELFRRLDPRIQPDALRMLLAQVHLYDVDGVGQVRDRLPLPVEAARVERTRAQMSMGV